MRSLLLVILIAANVSLDLACSETENTLRGTEGAVCYANNTCNTGLVCLSHLCVALPDGGSITFNTPSGQLADQGVSPNDLDIKKPDGGFMPFPLDDWGGPGGPVMRPCPTGNECMPEEICIDGMCQRNNMKCINPEDCPPGMNCVNNQCRPLDGGRSDVVISDAADDVIKND